MYSFLTKLKIKRSYLWAFAFACAIGVWLLSGMITRLVSSPSSETSAGTKSVSTFRVRVQKFASRPRQAEITVRGRTEAIRRIELRAQTAGIIDRVPHAEGTRVSKGDLLCGLELSTRTARLAEAKAKLAQAELDLNAASKLASQNFVSKTKRAAEQAKYDAASAGVVLMEKEMEYTRIRAPRAGVIEKRPAEPGSFLQIGKLCAVLVVLDPIRMIGNISEREIQFVKTGMPGRARLITGDSVRGKVMFVSPTADKNTRTFRVELEVANPDFAIRDGLTAEISIPLPPTRAHLLSPAYLTLNDKGVIGVRIVDNASLAQFMPVAILADGKDGVWVSGLPEQVTVITAGQEYVTDGQAVTPVLKARAEK